MTLAYFIHSTFPIFKSNQKEFLKYLQHSLDQLSRLLTDQQRKPGTSLKLSSSESLLHLLTFAESWLAGLRYAGRPRSRLGKFCSGECCVGRVMVPVCAHGKLKPQPFPGVRTCDSSNHKVNWHAFAHAQYVYVCRPLPTNFDVRINDEDI